MSSLKKLFWKNWIVLLLGFVILLLPFLGFPSRISSWLYGLLGFCIVLLSFVIGRGLSYAYSAPTLLPRDEQSPQKFPRPRTHRPKPPAPTFENIPIVHEEVAESGLSTSPFAPGDTTPHALP